MTNVSTASSPKSDKGCAARAGASLRAYRIISGGRKRVPEKALVLVVWIPARV